MNITISGDSHGKYIIGIIEGIPSGINVNINSINYDLKRRQNTYGRGKRMSIENDKIEIVSGTWKNITTGAPLTFLIKNKSSEKNYNINSIPRPGHGDYVSWRKYKINNLNVYAERNSARWTCMLTALGSLAKEILKLFNIKIFSFTNSIGNISLPNNFLANNFNNINNSPIYFPDKSKEEEIINLIDSSNKKGITLGGSVRTIAQNIIPGIGNYESLNNKLDSSISAIFMSIPSVKGLIIGNTDFSITGNLYNDEFFFENNAVKRKSNNCGGIEAGFSNGEDIVITSFIKPLPTQKKPLDSIDLKTKENTKAPYIRSDTTIVPALVPITESALALVILDFILQQFGNGDIKKILRGYENENSTRWDDGCW